MGRACWGGAGRRAASLCAGAQTRGRQRPADAGVCSSRSGGGTSDNKTLPEYSPRPACDGGACWPVSPLSPWLPAPRHTHTQSRSSGRAIKHHTRTQHSVWASPQSRSAHSGGRGKLRLIQSVPRTVRNGAHLQTFLTGQSLQGQPHNVGYTIQIHTPL
jgi:hypothetical protein